MESPHSVATIQLSRMNPLQPTALNRTNDVGQRVEKTDQAQTIRMHQPLEDAFCIDPNADDSVPELWSQEELINLMTTLRQIGSNEIDWDVIASKIPTRTSAECQNQFHDLVAVQDQHEPPSPPPENNPKQHFLAFLSTPALHHSSYNGIDWFEWLQEKGFDPVWWNFRPERASSYPSPFTGELNDLIIRTSCDGTKEQMASIINWLLRASFRAERTWPYFSPELQQGLIFYLSESVAFALAPLLKKEQDDNPSLTIYNENTIRHVPAARDDSKFDLLDMVSAAQQTMAARTIFTHQVYVLDRNISKFLQLMERALESSHLSTGA